MARFSSFAVLCQFAGNSLTRILFSPLLYLSAFCAGNLPLKYLLSFGAQKKQHTPVAAGRPCVLLFYKFQYPTAIFTN